MKNIHLRRMTLKSAMSKLGRTMNLGRVTHLEISTEKRLRFKRQIFHVPI